jgi:hypothetical protein
VLNLAYNLDALKFTITSAGARVRTLPEQDPLKAFDKVFSFAKPGAAPVDVRVARRKLALDATMKDLDDYAKSAPRDDREKLQSHIEGVRKLEADLQGSASLDCRIPPRPGARSGPSKLELMFDVTAQALACDVTRVVTIQVARPHAGFSYAFAGAGGDHHDNSHDQVGSVGDANFKRAGNWFAGQMGYLMTKLAAIPEEGGKTALDNTAIVWVSDVASSLRHDNVNCGFIIGGGLGGAVRGGRVLNVNGKTNNDMWVGLMRGMGLGDTSFGSPNYNTGAINFG